MTSHDFAQFFRSSIRVLLDWDAIERSEWPVDVTVISSAGELEGWYFPWHVGVGGGETRFDDPAAQALRILDWPSPAFTGHREAVDAIREWLQGSSPPVQLVIAAYALPRGGRIVLDGNHRLAAIVQDAVPFRALAATLHGPPDEDVLPDLRQWIR